MNAQAHYLRLWKSADELLAQPDNPCQVVVREDGKVSCAKTRNNTFYQEVPGHTWCCSGCEHLGPEGCTVKALGCKLGWCTTSYPNIPGTDPALPIFEALSALRVEAYRLRLPTGVRRSYAQSFG